MRCLCSSVVFTVVLTTFSPEQAIAGAITGAITGKNRPHLALESALLVWNPRTRIQHTYLIARFEGIDGPFTWWLPFPSEPHASFLDEGCGMILPRLLGAYRARTRWEVPLLPGDIPRQDLALSPLGTLGSQDALLNHPLTSKDGLSSILKQHDIEEDMVLQDYLDRYLETKATLVAIRFHPRESNWTTPCLHIRFETQRPWYPYREPAYPHSDTLVDKARLLRLSLLTTERVAVQHGPSLPTSNHTWLAYEPTHDEVRRVLGERYEQMGFDDEERLWLTSFEDRVGIRPGNDDWSLASMGAIPEDGERGTIGDTTREGLHFEPLADALVKSESHLEKVVLPADDDAQEQKKPHPSDESRSKKQKTNVFWALMALFGLGLTGWLEWGGKLHPRIWTPRLTR